MSDTFLFPTGYPAGLVYDGAAAAVPAAAAAVNTATPAPANSSWAGLFGMIGASASQFANTYIDAAAKKAAGVSTTPATTPAVAQPVSGSMTLSGPLVIGGLVFAAGLGLFLILRRD